jgi:hypothetical protein
MNIIQHVRSNVYYYLQIPYIILAILIPIADVKSFLFNNIIALLPCMLILYLIHYFIKKEKNKIVLLLTAINYIYILLFALFIFVRGAAGIGEGIGAS